VVTHTEQIIVKKRRVSFEKVKLADVNVTYKTKLKDKGEKYYSKFKIKDKDGNDKDRMLISIKITYKDYKYKDKEDDVIIVTGYDLKTEAEIDAFIDENIRNFERDLQSDQLQELMDECDDSEHSLCEHVVKVEEYE
jgi:hypothetical protein